MRAFSEGGGGLIKLFFTRVCRLMNQAGDGTRPQRRDANEAAPRFERQAEAHHRLLKRQSEATGATKVFEL